MKIRHKIYIFLSLKYNIKIFNRFEKKLVNEHIPTGKKQHTKLKVLYRFLAFSKLGSKPNFFNEVRILKHIIIHRGKLRTLLSISNPFSHAENFFEISRFNLLLMILQNFKLFRTNLLRKLSFEYLDFQTYSSFDVYPATQLGNKLTIKKFQKFDFFLIEKKHSQSFKMKIEQHRDSKHSVIHDFVQWNSNLYIKFIKKYNLEQQIDSLYTGYNLLFNESSKFRIINVLDHQMSNSTFDEIYEKNGLNHYVIILNAEIWHQRFIFTQNVMINLDATASPSLAFVAGNWPFIWKVKGNPSKYKIVSPYGSPLRIKEAIYLIGRVDENWYHFLLDTAPRMLFLDNVPMSVPVLIRNDIPQTFKDLLRAITTRKMIEIDAADFVEVEVLYVLPGRSTASDSRLPKGANWVEFSPVVLNLFRNKVLESMSIGPNQALKRRISFNRKSTVRNVINWGKIRQELDHFSFDDISFDSKFFRSQVQIFSNSNVVVSPGGAVLANIIFMDPGSKVFALTSFRGQNVELWRKLSESLDLKYVSVKGIPTYWGFRHLRKLHSNFYISPRKLRRILSREI